MLQASTNDLVASPFWTAALEIIFINILLSGDNAVIIAMACRALPGRQRLFGLLIGGAFAVLLLIVFALLLTHLLEVPYLKIAGGLALLYIAVRLLLPEEHERTEAEASTQLWRAVRIIVVADIVMSFDNILAVVQVAKGDLALLAIGLAVSVPVILAGAALFTKLLDRLPILVWAGAALLGWIGGQTIVGDAALAGPLGRLTGAVGGEFSGRIELAAGFIGAIVVIAAGGLWRHRRISKS
jgi:YjbE family integral membrane protein